MGATPDITLIEEIVRQRLDEILPQKLEEKLAEMKAKKTPSMKSPKAKSIASTSCSILGRSFFSIISRYCTPVRRSRTTNRWVKNVCYCGCGWPYPGQTRPRWCRKSRSMRRAQAGVSGTSRDVRRVLPSGPIRPID